MKALHGCSLAEGSVSHSFQQCQIRQECNVPQRVTSGHQHHAAVICASEARELRLKIKLTEAEPRATSLIQKTDEPTLTSFPSVVTGSCLATYEEFNLGWKVFNRQGSFLKIMKSRLYLHNPNYHLGN